MALLCLVLNGESPEANERLLRQNRRYIDLAELRIDFLNPGAYESIGDWARQCDCPLILTARRKADGGCWPEDWEDERRAVLEHCLESGRFAYADLEHGFYGLEDRARRHRTRIIRSYHQFEGPLPETDQLKKIIRKGQDEIPKWAVMLHSLEDLGRLLDFSRGLRGLRKIVIGMGDYGVPSRILAESFGSFLSFGGALPREDSPGKEPRQADMPAPGQYTVRELHELYRFPDIKEETPLFGIIGQPVLHTHSPRLHNRWLKEQNLPGVYLPFPADSPESFKDFSLKLPLKGFSVTLPHKERIIPLLSRQDPETRLTGACNTVCCTEEGWEGFNTDIEGFLAPIRDFLEERAPSSASKKEGGPALRAAVIGAGGAARSVLFGLQSLQKNLDLCLFNRTYSKARRLAREFSVSAYPLEDFPREAPFDLIVQTGSGGMAPREDIDPLAHYRFSGRERVYDLIYKPSRTKMLRRAEEAGCTVLNGAAMLEAQARKQFELFTRSLLQS